MNGATISAATRYGAGRAMAFGKEHMLSADNAWLPYGINSAVWVSRANESGPAARPSGYKVRLATDGDYVGLLKALVAKVSKHYCAA